MARAPRSSRSRITRMSLGDILDKARDQGFAEEFVDFLDITLKQFAGDFAQSSKEIARRMGAEDTGRLIDSIYPRSIVFKEGDAKAGIAMEIYGFYVNAGVGKGITATERQTGVALTSSRNLGGYHQRSPKPFIDESLMINQIKLEELLGKQGSDFIADLLSSSLSQKIRVEL